MDRITSMEIFVRAVELGSFSAVAEERGISAQMVGKHVRGLESNLGTKLLAKSTRFQSVTAAGERYYQRCQTILAELKAAEEDIYRNMNEPSGKLKISTGVNVGIKVLAPSLAQFMQRYPKLEIDLVVDNRLPDIKQDGFEVIFRDKLDGYENLIAHKLRSFAMVVCASPEYLQKHGTPTHPNELTHHQCLQSSIHYLNHNWSFFDGQQRFQPEVSSKLTINSGQAMMSAAIEGAGITMQPIFQVKEALKEGRLIQVLSEYQLPEVNLYMIYLPSLRDTARVTLLKEHLTQVLNSDKYNKNKDS